MTRIQTFRNRFSGCIVNGYVRIGCNFMDLDETVSSFIERYSPTAEPAGCFVFHGCVIHLVLHRQILNGVEYDEPVAAAIVDVDRALVFEIEFAKRMEQTVGGRSLAQIQRTIRFTARMGNNNLQPLGSIRSGRAFSRRRRGQPAPRNAPTGRWSAPTRRPPAPSRHPARPAYCRKYKAVSIQ